MTTARLTGMGPQRASILPPASSRKPNPGVKAGTRTESKCSTPMKAKVRNSGSRPAVDSDVDAKGSGRGDDKPEEGKSARRSGNVGKGADIKKKKKKVTKVKDAPLKRSSPSTNKKVTTSRLASPVKLDSIATSMPTNDGTQLTTPATDDAKHPSRGGEEHGSTCGNGNTPADTFGPTISKVGKIVPIKRDDKKPDPPPPSKANNGTVIVDEHHKDVTVMKHTRTESGPRAGVAMNASAKQSCNPHLATPSSSSDEAIIPFTTTKSPTTVNEGPVLSSGAPFSQSKGSLFGVLVVTEEMSTRLTSDQRLSLRWLTDHGGGDRHDDLAYRQARRERYIACSTT